MYLLVHKLQADVSFMQGVRFNFEVQEVYEYISQPGQAIIARENLSQIFFVCSLTFIKKRFPKDMGNILLTNDLSQILFSVSKK